MDMFPEVRPVSLAAINILRKRYFDQVLGETEWNQVADRSVDHVVGGHWCAEDIALLRQLIRNRYFVPNSPCLVNSGKKNGGLLACFVVGFYDSIEQIFKTKLDFALIAKKGGGCGTSLSNIRPKNSPVAGSAHGFSGGPIDFYDSICHDMEVMTQAGFRQMAQMGTMSVRHPDILQFITVKEQEGKMTTTNLSVMVDDDFMQKVVNDEAYWTEFNGVKYQELRARDVFNLIVEGAWKNGEPGLLFGDTINNNSPYKFAGVKIEATNPCGEQPLPPNGSCNLGSLDISKFIDPVTKEMNWETFEIAIRLGVRFLDAVIDENIFPTHEIEETSIKSRQIGLGLMGLADYFLIKGLAYGSKESIEEEEKIFGFMRNIAENESEYLGKLYGIPEWCQKLPIPRRNITVLSIAPTGTISLIAGCSSGIEPVFSEIVARNDKTGTYTFVNNMAAEPYFRCAVSSTGEKEVTWEEHIAVQAAAQKYIDSGVSKTINLPNRATRETISKAFIKAWQSGCKGITVYRNGSRKVEVLSPVKNKIEKCPVCGKNVIRYNDVTKCISCDWHDNKDE